MGGQDGGHKPYYIMDADRTLKAETSRRGGRGNRLSGGEMEMVIEGANQWTWIGGIPKN